MLTITRRTRTAEMAEIETGAIEMATRDIINRQQDNRMKLRGQSVQLILLWQSINAAYRHFFDKTGNGNQRSLVSSMCRGLPRQTSPGRTNFQNTFSRFSSSKRLRPRTCRFRGHSWRTWGRG